MKNNKRGLSTVVTTLILILLVIVAIGIVWLVMRNLIESSSSQADIGTKCLAVNLEIESVSCADVDDCSLQIKKTGGSEIDGVKIVFIGDSGDSGTVLDEAGDISLIETYSNIDPELDDGVNPEKVTVAAYFLNEEDEASVCQQSVEASIE